MCVARHHIQTDVTQLSMQLAILFQAFATRQAVPDVEHRRRTGNLTRSPYGTRTQERRRPTWDVTGRDTALKKSNHQRNTTLESCEKVDSVFLYLIVDKDLLFKTS